ncbi:MULTISPECIES: hypothetical protein [Sutcliffiella]|uniref:Uncharacterized protein n=1 Tax=Sutcliffiella cohnii TaxID=33932 RepID=A0A223KQF5_9BACI|nr:MULTISPECIES: hypothetical protein [Sutcliffiella]AST91731.1 hypothetical protein BC6307_10805 [Sutcliffiella cohnii]MED4014715.1 hypothetical protein [Sutcliffiella cohnii]WBL12946.1 hypothetical protein O1A01_13460 [Sutcliffiella sp. NC1]
MFCRNVIGTAWLGTHVVVIRCSYPQLDFIHLSSSDHAPLEPVSKSCAETLSRFLSIGYKLIGAYPMNGEVIFVLTYV